MKITQLKILKDGDVVDKVEENKVYIRTADSSYCVYTFHLDESDSIIDYDVLMVKNSIELAAWTHAEFVKIHSFPGGNGRASRLIMNYQLMVNVFILYLLQKKTDWNILILRRHMQ